VLYPVPHRQYVFSIPKIIRRYFLYDRKLLGKLAKCATSSLTTFFKTVLNKDYGIPGIALAIQSFTAKSTLLGTMQNGIRISMLWWPMVFSPKAGTFM